MPIRFESQQPFDAAAAYAAGQSGPSFGDIADLVRMRQQSINQQMSIGADFASRDADRRQSGAELAFRTKAQDQWQQNEQRSNESMRTLQVNQQIGQATAELQVRTAMQQMEFTHADRQKLDKLYLARSNIASMLDSHDITPEEAKAYLMQVQTGINPLEARLKNTKTKQDIELGQQQVAAGQRAAAVINANEATRNQMWKQTRGMSITLQDGTTLEGQINDKGVFEPFNAGGGGAAKPWDEAKGWTDAMKIANAKYPVDELDPASRKRHQEGVISEYNRLEAAAKGRGGNSATPGQAPGQPGQPGQQPPAVQIGGVLQQGYRQFADDPKKAREWAKSQLSPEAAKVFQPPYDVGANVEGLTFDQQTARATFEDMRKMLPEGIGDAVKGRVETLVKSLEGLHAQYGSKAQMPPEVAAEYDKAKAEARNIATNARSNDATRNTATAQQLLDARLPWDQAAAAMKAQGIDPAPFEKQYKDGLDYQNRLEQHEKATRKKLTGRKPI